MTRTSLVASALVAGSLTLGLLGCRTPDASAPDTGSAAREAAPSPEPAEASKTEAADEGQAEAARARSRAEAEAERGPDAEAPPQPLPGGGSGDRKAATTEIVAIGDAGSSGSNGGGRVDGNATENPDAASTEAETDERAPLPKPLYKSNDKKQCRKDFSVGDKVKPFKLTSVDGDKTIAPTGYRGRVMLLNFWATWCKPCLEELPEFDRLYRRYRNSGMTLVAVATDEDAKAVQEFADKHKLIAKIALGGEKAAGEYNRPNFPFSLVVDGEGEIVAAFDFVDEGCLGELEQIIRSELEKL